MALLAAILGGCVSYQPRPIDAAKSAAEWQSRSLDSAELHSFLAKHLRQPPQEWPLVSWDLERLTAAAFFYNPSLEVARAQWRGGIAAEQTAGQRPNPTLTLSPGYDFTATSLGANPWLPFGTIDVPIETMGKRGHRQAQARAAEESARLALAQSAWQVWSAVRTGLVSLVNSRERRALLKKQEQVQREIVESIQKRVDAGAASSTELALVQTAWHRTQLDLLDAERAETDSLHALAAAVGIPAGALADARLEPVATQTPGNVENPSLGSLRDSGLRHRADILGALADYAASEAALQLQIAKQYPDVHLTPNYQYNQGDHQFNLGFTAELPLLNQNQGPIAEATAHRDEMAARFYETQARAIDDIEHSFESYQQALGSSGSLQSLAESQRKQAASVKAQADAGAADRLDLLNSQVDLLSGEILRLDAQVKLQTAFGALENAVQSPVESLDAQSVETANHPLPEKKP